MSLYRLKYFVSVAKLKSFTKAARECHIAQSAISQQINLLERELGVELFYRDSHKVELTAAGQVYYEDAKAIIERNALSVEKMRRIARGEKGTLTIGICGYEEESIFIDRIRRFHKAKPDIQLKFLPANYEGYEKGLNSCRYDLIFSWPYDFENHAEIGYRKLMESETGILLSREHYLAERKNITIEELSIQTHILISPLENTRLYDHYLHFFRQADYPEHIIRVQNASVLRMMVEMNQGISVVPILGLQLNRELVLKETPVPDHKIETGLIYLKENQNPCLRNFLDYINISK
ncbi:LysR family transcriptional regulator [Lacrimispora sp.]|uniref:LysR family transcriptional regulator n=1 Tax=Lacrimispora sp. TaxID=2719234 RepID=UPI0029E67ACC|nr:hypothetical protein [Lacrimispora sp.]